MSLRKKRNALYGVVGALGVVVGLAGYLGQYYSPLTATFLMLAVFILGPTLVNLFTDPPE